MQVDWLWPKKGIFKDNWLDATESKEKFCSVKNDN